MRHVASHFLEVNKVAAFRATPTTKPDLARSKQRLETFEANGTLWFADTNRPYYYYSGSKTMKSDEMQLI